MIILSILDIIVEFLHQGRKDLYPSTLLISVNIVLISTLISSDLSI